PLVGVEDVSNCRIDFRRRGWRGRRAPVMRIPQEVLMVLDRLEASPPPRLDQRFLSYSSPFGDDADRLPVQPVKLVQLSEMPHHDCLIFYVVEVTGKAHNDRL